VWFLLAVWWELFLFLALRLVSGALPIQGESPGIESRPKPATKVNKYVAFNHANSKPQPLIRA
jgi:hypothetical protein